MQAEYYLNMIRALISKTQRFLNVSFDTALNLAISLFAEINKDRRVSEMLRKKQLITAKQLLFLQKLGISVKPEISKEEASKIISAELRKGSNGFNRK